VASVALLIPVAQGCGGGTGPAAPSWSERAVVEAARLEIRLGIDGQRRFVRVENGRRIYGDEDEWIRDQFIAAMHERKLFREVERLDAFDSPPDLVATVSRHVDGDNPLPFFTFLTLGIYPTVANGTERLESFTAPAPSRCKWQSSTTERP